MEAANHLWDKDITNPTSDNDLESPTVNAEDTIGNVSEDQTVHSPVTSGRSISKGVKLGAVLVLLTVAVVLALTLGLDIGSTGGEGGVPVNGAAVQQGSGSASSSSVGTDTATTSTSITKDSLIAPSDNTQYFTSTGPLPSKLKMISPAITNGYETCSDLEKDIVEAMKHSANSIIMEQVESSEMYASCDPENDDWYSAYYEEHYGYDYHYWEGYYGEL